MRRLIAILSVAVLALTLSCPGWTAAPRVTATAQGGGAFVVTVDGVELSRHTSMHKALEAATNAGLSKPDAAVIIEQALRIKVDIDPGATPTPAPAPTPVPAPAASDYDTASKAANVVKAYRGNEPGFVNNDPSQYTLALGSMKGTHTRPVYDAAVGGLRFDIPVGSSGSDISGSFYFNFGRDFGANQRFRVRWQQMFNAAMLETDIGDTAIKQVVIGSGDAAGRPGQTSCTAPDIVAVTYYGFRFSHLYHACGRYLGLYGAGLNFQNRQPAVEGAAACDYAEASRLVPISGTRVIPKACAGWAPAMTWQDYAVDVENGPIDGAQYAWSVVRYYIGKNADGTLHLAHEWDSRVLKPEGFNGRGLWVGNAATGERFFGKFWATPYMTASARVWPALMQTWYRNMIVTEEGASPAPTPTPTPTSELERAFVGLAAGSALDLGPFTWTDTGGHWNAYSISDYAGLAYDAKRRQWAILGGGHASTDYDAVALFKRSMLKWAELYPPTPGTAMTPANYDAPLGAWKAGPVGPYPRPAARHTADLNVIVGDELILMGMVEGNGRTAGANWPAYTSYELLSSARIVHVNLNTGAATFTDQLADAVSNGFPEWGAVEFDPPSGKVIQISQYGLYVYDPAAKKKTKVQEFVVGDYSYNRTLVYYPPNQRHYLVAPAGVFEIELDRANFAKSVIRRVAAAPATASKNRFAYDSKNGVIGGGLLNGVWHAFDPRTKAWESRAVVGPAEIAFQAMDYSPEDNIYLFMAPGGRTWAYRWN